VRDIYEADGTAFVKKEPLLIVVNKGTASASEVMAGALKDNSRATVLGEQSFGKGLIQTVIPLSGEDSARPVPMFTFSDCLSNSNKER
jgi:carboxyl-terminal processing protease